MVYITRREHFNAAHRLYNPEWTDEENYAVFGKCANKNWHGHNFDLYVTVKGKVNPQTGFVMNVKDLGAIIKREIIEHLDHKNLNLDVPFMQGILPSMENLAVKIWELLEPHLPEGVSLHAVRIHETENIYAEYFGEES